MPHAKTPNPSELEIRNAPQIHGKRAYALNVLVPDFILRALDEQLDEHGVLEDFVIPNDTVRIVAAEAAITEAAFVPAKGSTKQRHSQPPLRCPWTWASPSQQARQHGGLPSQRKLESPAG